MAKRGRDTDQGRGIRHTAHAMLAAAIVLGAVAAGWWQVSLHGTSSLPASHFPAFDPWALFAPGGLLLVGGGLRLVAGLRGRRDPRASAGREDTAAAAPPDNAPGRTASPPSPPATETPLETVLQEAAGLGLKVHTTRAGYVLREAGGRELVYADPRLLASAVRRHSAG